MTVYSFTRNYAPNVVDLGVDRLAYGRIAKQIFFSAGGDVTLVLTGGAKGHATERRTLVAPLLSTLALSGSIRGGVDPSSIFTDFARATAAQTVDPSIAIVKAKSSNVAYDGSATGGFRRVSMSLTVPNDTSTQRRAAYIAPGVKIVGLTQNNGVNIDAVQVEIAQAGATTPTPYSPARTLQVGVRPNRLNWGWSKGTTGWALVTPTGGAWSGSQPTVVSSGAPDDNGAFLRGTISTASTLANGGLALGSSGSNVLPILPGVPWSYRALLRMSRAGTVQMMVRWYNDSAVQVGGGTAYSNVTLTANTWAEVRLDGAVPPAGATRAYLSFYLISGANWAIGDTMDVAGMLSEQAPKAGTYFDGLSGADYLFEQGGAAPGTRSYYYEDYAVRSYLLKQVLAENCPLGVIPAVPQFAVQPRF